MTTKIVAYPITVPENEFCWNYDSQSCKHFCYKDGHTYCNLFNITLTTTNKGILKLKRCKKLKTLKGD